MVGLCKAADAEAGEPMTTRELALAVIRAKRWEAGDKVLHEAGSIAADRKRGDLRVWRVAPA